MAPNIIPIEPTAAAIAIPCHPVPATLVAEDEELVELEPPLVALMLAVPVVVAPAGIVVGSGTPVPLTKAFAATQLLVALATAAESD